MINILIVEDNAEQRNALECILSNYSSINNTSLHIYKADCYDSAIQIIDTCSIHIYFFDIELDADHPDQDGMHLASYVRENCGQDYAPILFLTSFLNYIEPAINTYHCLNYIRKPYSEKDIYACMDSILKHPQFLESHIFLVDLYGIHLRIKTKQILYMESKSHIVYVYTTSGLYKTHLRSLGDYEKLLGNDFIRCHRKYILQLDFIDTYDRCNTIVTLKDGTQLNIGRSYKTNFEERYFHYA